MNSKLILVFAAVVCISLTAAGQQSKSPSDSSGVTTEELQRTTTEWLNAYNANDMERLASFYTEDADYVSPHVKGLILHGREQILANFRRGVAGGGHLDSVAVERSGSSCDLAYLVTSYHATNSGATVHGKNVLVMKRVEGKWLIVTHASIVRD